MSKAQHVYLLKITIFYIPEIFFIKIKLNNKDHNDHQHVTFPDFCVIKKILPTTALTLQGVFIEASKSMSMLKIRKCNI